MLESSLSCQIPAEKGDHRGILSFRAAMTKASLFFSKIIIGKINPKAHFLRKLFSLNLVPNATMSSKALCQEQ